MFTKIIAFFTSIIMFVFPFANVPNFDTDKDKWNTNYDYVFVHGLGGWGEYDVANAVAPYWGVMGGDLMKYLNSRGYNCHAASVDPVASCWDRACELYAQLTGTRTDYGKEHSERCNHPRYGTNYKGKALLKNFSAENKINLLGHSFGGATILQFASLMEKGSEAEIKATDKKELSPLFTGGKQDWIYSITTLAAPMNGTTAYYLKDIMLADPNSTWDELLVCKVVGALAGPLSDGRDELDCAGYDMEIDRAMSLCKEWGTNENWYYFSYACDITDKDENGNLTCDKRNLEIVYMGACNRMATWIGETPSGYKLDEKWWPNDGLVNTISARAPFDAPQMDFDKNNINKGIWNMMPVYRGDHMSLQGGMTINNNVRLLYAELLDTINSL